MKLSKTSFFIVLTVLSLVAISWVVYSRSHKSPLAHDSTSAFSATRAYDHVKHLAQKIGPRPAGSKSELAASQYISYVLRQNGWKVREQSFSKVVIRDASIIQPEQTVELINSQNIIAELPGTIPDTIIAGAHYDSASINAPGAIDNASGVGTLLELSRVLSEKPHEETIQLIFFGAEESGLVGSQFYAEHADLSAARWMLNVDMIGTPLEIDVAGKKSAPPELIQQVVALARESAIPFKLSRDEIMMTRESSQGGSSDFSSFLDQGIPALGLGISGRPAGYYHRPEDLTERVSLEELQRVGNFTHQLLTSVKLEKQGPSEWDELYLPFQIGNNLFIATSNILRCFTFLTFLLTGLILLKLNRKNLEKQTLIWRKVLWILGVALLMSVMVVALSGMGESLWNWIKHVQTLYSAYPWVFVVVRIGIALGIFIFIASWFHQVPLPRDPHLYWLTGVLMLFAVSVILALNRIDLSFPFVFWLLCMDLQLLLPNILMVLIGPYFIYTMHFKLLNSEQWMSFYETTHKYSVVFLGIYSLLLIPFFLATFHIAITNRHLYKKLLYYARKPALLVMGLLVLCIGLVPVYSRSHPQVVTVREEWSGKSEGVVHIFSDQRLPHKLVSDLNGQEGTSQFVPILNEASPINVEATVSEQNKDSVRELDITFNLNYILEPYLVSFELVSAQPFEIQTYEFLPTSKLPKKLELKGVKQSSGNYSLKLKRTPPHKKVIELGIKTQGIMTCIIEAVYSDLTPRLQIKDPLISVDYQIQYNKSYEF